MEIDIYCMNCKEYVLQADTDELETPMRGDMFTVRKGREWMIFTPDAREIELECPMCGWLIHEDGKLMARNDNANNMAGNTSVFIGTAPEVVEFFTRKTPQQEAIEKHYKQYTEKPPKKRGWPKGKKRK